MRKAIVDGSGNVVNVIEITEGAAFRLPAGQSLVDADGDAEPGGTYDGSRFERKAVPVIPDVTGLRQALLDQWGLEKSNTLATKYPLFDSLLDRGRFDLARQLLTLAAGNGDLTPEEFSAVEAAFTAHNIPE